MFFLFTVTILRVEKFFIGAHSLFMRYRVKLHICMTVFILLLALH